jgi:hypothetical protein
MLSLLMRGWSNVLALAVIAAIGASTAPVLEAQATPADSAGVLYEAALRLDAEGERGAAQELLRFVIRNYPGTPAAAAAQQRLDEQVQVERAGSGRSELMVWYTLYGGWLGVAVPAALGADDPEPYGLGLLVGAPVGFLLSREYARSTSLTSGQARVIDFGSQWGTWQGFGLRAALDLGAIRETVCFGPDGSPPCDTFERDSERAPWAAMVLGGLTGTVASALLARGRPIPSGAATYAIHGAYWGTWYGLAGSILADVADGDQTLTWVLVGGNLGLLATSLSAPRTIGSGRVWLVTAGGIAGIAAGFGLDLLLQPDDEDLAILVPMIGSALGLFLASRWTRSFDGSGSDDSEVEGNALLNVRSGKVAVRVPALVPMLIPRDDARRGSRRLGVSVPLFQLRH